MYCEYCGKSIEKDAKFCIFCGKPIVETIPSIKEDEICCANSGKVSKEGSILCDKCSVNLDDTSIEVIENNSSPKEKHCSNCGKQIADKSLFCPYCGVKIQQQVYIFTDDKSQHINNVNQPTDGSMKFSEAIKSCFEKYTDFSGRARRSEYWWLCILNIIIIGLLELFIHETRSGFFTVLYYLYLLGIICPSLAVLVRRVHDTGHKWTFILWNLLPIIGSIIVLIELVKDSDSETNEFGPCPK